ncbi:uncharacterized protein LOC116346097 [Contarinia nasturtii]|uniref:uncharacterized protein LOC116346097 n=1 Tax=Contarinia nasturtii TaxID=265458 RepID=UPI0012D428ED|nr:uncharacterized protein LOC116346097 [Contarinia nasturtii]
MEDENDANLNAVFQKCNNNIKLFLSTVAKYTATKIDFSTKDILNVPDLFETAFEAAQKDIANKQPQHEVTGHETLIVTDNGTTDASKGLQIDNDDSRDMFESENIHNNNTNDNDDDDIVPETQFFPEDTTGSGESVDIPFYTNDMSDDESDNKIAHIHADSAAEDFTETQSQMIMVNLDQSLLRIENYSKAPSTTRVTVAENDANSTNVEIQADDDDETNNRRVDRSESSTPDLDFLTQSNEVHQLKLAAEEPQENDCDETQMFSQSIFDESTNQVIQALSPNQTSSTEDIFAVATQPPPAIFKQPMAISTPKVATKQKDVGIYDEPTQRLEPESRMSAKKTVTWERKSNQNNNSDEIFDMETQVFVQPNVTSDASAINENPDEDGIFEAETQIIEPPTDEIDIYDMPTQRLQLSRMPAKKRFQAIATESSQPANTPDWSLAARITKDDIDRHEKQLEEQRKKLDAEQKKKDKVKKNRRLFSSSSEEDENEDDLEFDLPKPVQEPPRRRKSANFIKRSNSDSDDDYNEVAVSKKSKLDGIETNPKNIKLRRVSVNLSRDEFSKLMENEVSNKSKNHAKDKLQKASSENKKNAKATTIEDTKERNLRQRTVETRNGSTNNKRKPEPVTVKPKEKRDKMEPATSSSTKSIDNAEIDKPKTRRTRKTSHTKEEPTQTRTTTTNDSLNLLPTNRRNSERVSTRNSTRQAILFTLVNPAPYTTVIPKLGGCIVDTVQLGTVLICDRVGRTFKFLYAMSKGIPIVSSRWLDVSAKNGEFEPTNSYLLVDKNSEKRYQFNLKKSLEIARHTPLFKNYHIFATHNVQPTKEEIAEIVECCGGKFADNPDKKRKPNTVAVLISNKKDSKMWNAYRKAHPDVQIVSSEGFMQSILKQKITFPDYLLFLIDISSIKRERKREILNENITLIFCLLVNFLVVVNRSCLHLIALVIIHITYTLLNEMTSILQSSKMQHDVVNALADTVENLKISALVNAAKISPLVQERTIGPRDTNGVNQTANYLKEENERIDNRCDQSSMTNNNNNKSTKYGTLNGSKFRKDVWREVNIDETPKNIIQLSDCKAISFRLAASNAERQRRAKISTDLQEKQCQWDSELELRLQQIRIDSAEKQKQNSAKRLEREKLALKAIEQIEAEAKNDEIKSNMKKTEMIEHSRKLIERANQLKRQDEIRLLFESVNANKLLFINLFELFAKTIINHQTLLNQIGKLADATNKQDTLLKRYENIIKLVNSKPITITETEQFENLCSDIKQEQNDLNDIIQSSKDLLNQIATCDAATKPTNSVPVKNELPKYPTDTNRTTNANEISVTDGNASQPQIPVIRSNNNAGSEDRIAQYFELINYHRDYYAEIQPLFTSNDDNLKKFRFNCQKSVNTPVNSISAVSVEHLQDKFKKISDLLSGNPTLLPGDIQFSAAEHPLGIKYCTFLLAKKFITQGTTVTSSHHQAAFPIAAVLVSIWQLFPDVGKLFLALLYIECPFLVPYIIPQKNGQTDTEYFKTLGYKFNDDKMEDEEQHLKRISGLQRLYSAVLITKLRRSQQHLEHPHGIEYGWIWFSNFLMLDPLPGISASLMLEFIQICGAEMCQVYKKQFMKLLILLYNQYITKLEKIDSGGPFARLKELITNIVNQNKITPPSGTLQPNFW